MVTVNNRQNNFYGVNTSRIKLWPKIDNEFVVTDFYTKHKQWSQNDYHEAYPGFICLLIYGRPLVI